QIADADVGADVADGKTGDEGLVAGAVGAGEPGDVVERIRDPGAADVVAGDEDADGGGIRNEQGGEDILRDAVGNIGELFREHGGELAGDRHAIGHDKSQVFTAGVEVEIGMERCPGDGAVFARGKHDEKAGGRQVG